MKILFSFVLTLVLCTACFSQDNWGLDRIDQRTLPLDGIYNYSYTGYGIPVYIVDSGILLTHPEFQGRAIKGYGKNNNMETCSSHGTNVAGIVGSATYGVAKQATMVSVNVGHCNGVATLSDIERGLAWVKRQPKGIIQFGFQYTQALNTTVNELVADGFVFVIGSGNNGTDACPYSTPAAITVGATTRNDEWLSNTNNGPCVDVYAPGLGVQTTGVQAQYPVVFVSGTSFSAPYAAGVAALYLQANPNATPAEVQQAIVSNATSLSFGPLIYSMF